jgi:8-oxo-dGTP pyrophosphatase MutT (NUDIX family)
MYKVFFNDRILELSSSFPRENPDAYDLIQPFKNNTALKHSVDNWLQSEVGKALIYFKDVDFLFSQFASLFIIIKAAGGLVFRSDGRLLLIFRRGKWDLPKGKQEKGESWEETALREVSEETNLDDLHMNSHITDTYHVYYMGNNAILKQTHWYHMISDGKDKLIPQVKEDITDVLWVKPEELSNYSMNTYESINEVFRTAGVMR